MSTEFESTETEASWSEASWSLSIVDGALVLTAELMPSRLVAGLTSLVMVSKQTFDAVVNEYVTEAFAPMLVKQLESAFFVIAERFLASPEGAAYVASMNADKEVN